MPYVTVPKDLSNIKNKIAMGLTKRQLLAVMAAGVICVPIYLLTMRAMGDLALYIAVVPAIPCFMTGFYHSPDGRPLEKVLANYVQVRYKQPMVRPYQTQNIYISLSIMQEIQEVTAQYEAEENDSGIRNSSDNQENKTP